MTDMENSVEQLNDLDYMLSLFKKHMANKTPDQPVTPADMLGIRTTSSRDIKHWQQQAKYYEQQAYEWGATARMQPPPVSLYKSVHDLLVAALTAVRKNGWTKGTLRRVDGTMCILGALRETSHYGLGWRSRGPITSDMYKSAQVILLQKIKEYSPKGNNGYNWTGIPQFNDDPTTTFEDIEAVFEKAIAYAAEKGL